MLTWNMAHEDHQGNLSPTKRRKKKLKRCCITCPLSLVKHIWFYKKTINLISLTIPEHGRIGSNLELSMRSRSPLDRRVQRYINFKEESWATPHISAALYSVKHTFFCTQTWFSYIALIFSTSDGLELDAAWENVIPTWSRLVQAVVTVPPENLRKSHRLMMGMTGTDEGVLVQASILDFKGPRDLQD